MKFNLMVTYVGNTEDIFRDVKFGNQVHSVSDVAWFINSSTHDFFTLPNTNVLINRRNIIKIDVEIYHGQS